MEVSPNNSASPNMTSENSSNDLTNWGDSYECSCSCGFTFDNSSTDNNSSDHHKKWHL